MNSLEDGEECKYDKTWWVDPDDGDDSASGTESDPWRTIQKATDAANYWANVEDATCKINLEPGIYRQKMIRDGSGYDGAHARIHVEGAGPERTQIKGTEVYTNWTDEGDGVYSHNWAYSWGVAPDPEGGYITDCSGYKGNFCADEPDLVLRREVVFVDGERMEQVLNYSDLEPGTFYVDDGNKIYVQPPSGVSISDAKVEVGERQKAWETTAENNYTIEGLSVRQVPTPWKKGWAGIQISGSNFVVKNVKTINCNYNGMYVGGGPIILKNFVANRNGHSGIESFHLDDSLIEDGVANRNNWRGYLGGYTGWSPGSKQFKIRNTTFRNCTFAENKSKGLWFDNGAMNITVENVELRDNLGDNMWVEKSPGPVTLDRVYSTGAGEHGLVMPNTENLTIKNSAIVDNQRGGFLVTGDDVVKISDRETDQEDDITIETSDTTIGNSILSGVNGTVKGGGAGNKIGRFLIGTIYANQDWDDWVNTYTGYGNIWYESERDDALEWENDELITFSQWQNRTGQDTYSKFASFAVRAGGDPSASPGSESTVPITARTTESITVSQIPSDWILHSSDPDGGTVSDRISSDGEVTIKYDVEQDYVNAQLTFWVPRNEELQQNTLQIDSFKSDGSSTGASAIVNVN